MSMLGVTMSLKFIAVVLLLSVVPIWLAARVVGAGRQAFWRCAAALVLTILVAALLFQIVGGWGLLLWPVAFVVVFSKMLEVSYLRAFLLWILAAAFQIGITKVFGMVFGSGV